MSLRIISGERRGARLAAPRGESTRPLRDRVREALFNMIRGELAHARVLDAFAGSGAVGLEALSNSADRAVFADSSEGAIRALRQNVEKLRYQDRATILKGSSPSVLLRSRLDIEAFDLLFLMPPYHSGLGQEVLGHEGMQRLFAERCLAVLELHKDEPAELPEGWKRLQDRLYGITRLVFAEYQGPE